MIHFKIIAVKHTLPASSSGAQYDRTSFGSKMFVFALLATAGAGASSVDKKSDLIVCEGMACKDAFDAAVQLGLPKEAYQSIVSGSPIQVNAYRFLSRKPSTMEPNCLAGAIQIAQRDLNTSSRSSELLSTYINIYTFSQLTMLMAAYGFEIKPFDPSCTQNPSIYIEVMSEANSPGLKDRHNAVIESLHVAVVTHGVREEVTQISSGALFHVVSRPDQRGSIKSFSNLQLSETYIPRDFPYEGTETMRSDALFNDIIAISFSSYEARVKACETIYLACQSKEHRHLQAIQKELVKYASTIKVPDPKPPRPLEVFDKLLIDLISVDALLHLLGTEQANIDPIHKRTLKTIKREIKEYSTLFEKLLIYQTHFVTDMDHLDSGRDAKFFELIQNGSGGSRVDQVSQPRKKRRSEL
jgi:hypothetical protein